MKKNLVIRKATGRFMREDEKQAIARVNQAVPKADQAAWVGPELAARITAIRQNLGLVSERPELDVAETTV